MKTSRLFGFAKTSRLFGFGLPRRASLRRAFGQTVRIVRASAWLVPPDKPKPKPRSPRIRPRTALAPAVGFSEVAAFGSNPGALAMHLYRPARVASRGALVVILHGCGQQARDFARDSGWVAMADRLGIPLVLPEQVSANNRGRCFNWFRPDDVRRGAGEMLSIRQMAAVARRAFGSDPGRLYVVGLSAGASMAAACLAAYPDLFAGGAAVAGLPVGIATNVTSAISRMAHAGSELRPEEWALLARTSAPRHAGRYPRLSVWQGTADRTVDPHNAANLVAQWLGLAGEAGEPVRDETSPDGLHRRVWGSAARPVVEECTVARLAHGYPIAAGVTADRLVVPVGVDATAEIARFWGLAAA